MALNVDSGKIRLVPIAALPAAGTSGTLLVTSNHLYFDDGTTQQQLDGQAGRRLAGARWQYWIGSAF